jgi:HMG (high mobility group) box
MGDIGHWSSHRTPPSPHTPRQTKLKVKKEKKEKKEDKAKRPMNAFMLFAQEFRVRYTQEFPGRDNRYVLRKVTCSVDVSGIIFRALVLNLELSVVFWVNTGSVYR